MYNTHLYCSYLIEYSFFLFPPFHNLPFIDHIFCLLGSGTFTPVASHSFFHQKIIYVTRKSTGNLYLTYTSLPVGLLQYFLPFLPLFPSLFLLFHRFLTLSLLPSSHLCDLRGHRNSLNQTIDSGGKNCDAGQGRGHTLSLAFVFTIFLVQKIGSGPVI